MANNAPDDSQWTTIIEPPKKKLVLNLGDLWAYKYLIYLFIRRDFTTAYKQTILGPLWFVIQPLVTTGIYSIVFSGIAKIPTDEVPAPLFYLAGTTMWAFFANILNGNANVLSANASLFGKVFFPRLAVPLATSVSKLYQFAVQLIFLIVVFIVYLASGAKIQLSWFVLLLPLALLQLWILALGIGLWVSAWTVKYRDLGQLVSFGMSLWMWATPIVYPISFVTNDLLRTFIWFNPASCSIEMFRMAFVGTGTIHPEWIAYSWAWSILVISLGLGFFNRAERTYVDIA